MTDLNGPTPGFGPRMTVTGDSCERRDHGRCMAAARHLRPPGQHHFRSARSVVHLPMVVSLVYKLPAAGRKSTRGTAIF